MTIFKKIALSIKFCELLTQFLLLKRRARCDFTNANKKPGQKIFFRLKTCDFSKKAIFWVVDLLSLKKCEIDRISEKHARILKIKFYIECVIAKSKNRPSTVFD